MTPTVDQMTDTVLLVMDVQSMIVAPAPSEMLEAVARAIAGARTAGVLVVYVRVALRPGRAGVSPQNKRLTRLHPQLMEGAPGLDFHPAIAPERDDIVLTKHRVSAFAGSGLDALLRSLGATHLVLTGVSTSTAVLMTANCHTHSKSSDRSKRAMGLVQRRSRSIEKGARQAPAFIDIDCTLSLTVVPSPMWIIFGLLNQS